jgi:actin-related protein 8
VPHVIAYRTDKQTQADAFVAEVDETRVLRTSSSRDNTEEQEEAMSSMALYLKNRRQALGLQRTVVPSSQYTEFNASFEPVTTQMVSEIEWSDVKEDPRFVIGDKALYVPPGSSYRVYKPMKYGHLNINAHQSLRNLLDMLEDLWSQAIKEVLDIEKRDFKYHCVVLLIPDVTVRQHTRELTNLLLSRMGFAGVMLHQESVCAAFGAGLSSACVVDVGDEKTHIACVEDGISNPSTRLTLNVGGSDITRFFYKLLLECKFSYHKCNPEDRLDGLLVEELKETWCHLDINSYGIKVHDFQVIRPDRPTKSYTVKLADQTIYPPMAMFYPKAFQLPGEFLMSWQQGQDPDFEDYLDESHWLEPGLQSKHPKSSQDKEKTSEPSQNPPNGGNDVDEAKPLNKVNVSDKVKDFPTGSVPSLEEAIHMSIDCASSTEMKKKLYGSVLVVGGGLAFHGVAAMLQASLYTHLPAIFQKPLDAIEVSSNPRDMDPSLVAWKGAAVLCYLDTTQEMWIYREEWCMLGVRLLRERASFNW